MADTADVANDHAEMALGIALENRHRRVLPLSFTGLCYACESRVEAPKRFCDGDCADDWEKRQKK